MIGAGRIAYCGGAIKLTSVPARKRLEALAGLAARFLFALSEDRYGHVDPILYIVVYSASFLIRYFQIIFIRADRRTHASAASRTSPIPLRSDSPND